MSGLILPVITIAFSVIFLLISLSMPAPTRGVGPAAWPRTVLFSMLFLAIILLVTEYRAYLKAKAESAQLKKEAPPKQPYSFRHWISAGVAGLYFLIMGVLGFVPSTALFIAALSRILGLKNWKLSVLVSLASTAAITILFLSVLGMNVPRGVGIFRDFTLFLTR